MPDAGTIAVEKGQMLFEVSEHDLYGSGIPISVHPSAPGHNKDE
jgi:hypothetical protein